MSEVLEVGAGTTPDERSTVRADIMAVDDIDETFDIRKQWPFDDGSFDGLIATHVLEHLPQHDDLEHVFSEAARVLCPNGWFEVTVPIGADSFADPTHSIYWTWTTPDKFCRETRAVKGRHWDSETSFVLWEKSLDVRFYPPLHHFTPLLQAMASKWPAEAARRCSSGEIVASYRRVSE